MRESNNNPIPRSPTRFMLQMIAPPRIFVWFVLMFVMEAITVAAALGFSFVIKDLSKMAASTVDPTFASFEPILTKVAFLLGAIVVSQYIGRLSWRMGRVPFEMEAKEFLFKHTLKHSHIYFMNHHSGRVAEKIHGVPWLGILLWDWIIKGSFLGLAVVVITSAMLISLHPILGLIMVVWSILFTALLIVTGRFHGGLAVARADTKGHTMGAIVDSISNNAVMRLFAKSEHERATVQKYIDAEHRATARLTGNDRNMAVVRDLPFMILALLLLGTSAHLFAQGELEFADFAFVLTAVLVMMQFLQYFLSGIVHMFEEGSAIREGLELLGQPYDVVDAPDAGVLKVDKGQICFDHVTFSYNKNERVLRDFNLYITAGERIGVVGLSGAGKSTLVSLLLRFYDAPGQNITIDGQNIYDVTQDSLRENIAVIPQDTSLFSRTLMENIRYGREDASDEEVIEAAKKAHAHEFIAKLPEGYQTEVGERGVRLSGGQRQRIAIARAILKDAPILILDEATSALDSESEKLIQDSLETLMEGKTVIVIAHRLSTISHLDRLIVMERGQVVEEGSHDALIDDGGVYAKLWGMQSGGFLSD